MKELFKFTNENAQLDEIIFQNRNKSYGAYVLRHEYQKDLTKALFLGISIFVGIAATPFIINSFKTVEPTTIPAPDRVKIDLTKVDVPDKKDSEPVYAAPPKTNINTVKLNIPTPSHNPPVETPATPLSKTVDAQIGVEDIAGQPPTVAYQPPVINSVPSVVPAPPTVMQAPKEDNSVRTTVDVEATYNGGIDDFRNKVMSNFDTSDFDYSDGVLSTTVTFIVEKDGNISQLTAKGKDASFNKEAERTIRSVKGKWIPAKVNGQPVRSYFNFPITMKFQ